MKTKIFLLIIAAILFGGVYKAYGCHTVYPPTIISSFDPVYCGLYNNTTKVWFIYVGVGQQIQVRYSAQLPTTSFYSRFFIFDPPSDSLLYSPYQYLPYTNISDTDPGVLFNSWGGSSEGMVTTTSGTGWCAVVLYVYNNGGGAYKGINFEYSLAALDSTVVTDANVTVMGNQSVMQRLGIGTEDPIAPLHIQVPPINSNYKRVARYQADICNQSLYFDNFLDSWYYMGHVQGASLNNAYTTPQTLQTWIRQSPYDKNISFGSEQETYMTIQNGKVGIGTEYPDPQYALTVNGKIKATSIDASGSNLPIAYLTVSETAGIGVTNPVERLEVNGKTKISDNVGIGLPAGTSPTDKLEIYSGTDAKIRYTNPASGTGSTNGFIVGLESGGNGVIWTRHNNYVRFGTNANERMRILADGKVGIGTTTPSEKLDVNGTVKATTLSATITRTDTVKTKKVILTDTPGADFVFDPNYKLPELGTVEEHVKEHQHLPGIAPAAKMEEEGIDVAELNMQLLQKVEELYLYAIEQNKRLSEQNEQIIEQNERIAEQSDQITEQNKQIESQNERISTLEKALEKK